MFRQVFLSQPRHKDVSRAEVDPGLAGQPSQRQEPLGVPAVALAGHLLPAAPGVALHGGVAACAAPRCGASRRPSSPRGAACASSRSRRRARGRPSPRGARAARFRPAPPQGLGRQALRPGALPGRRPRRAGCPRDRGDWLTAPGPFAYTLCLVLADHSSPALPTSQTEATTLSGRPRMVGVPMPKAERISCSDPKLSDAQTCNFEAIKHNRRGDIPVPHVGVQ